MYHYKLKVGHQSYTCSRNGMANVSSVSSISSFQLPWLFLKDPRITGLFPGQDHAYTYWGNLSWLLRNASWPGFCLKILAWSNYALLVLSTWRQLCRRAHQQIIQLEPPGKWILDGWNQIFLHLPIVLAETLSRYLWLLNLSKANTYWRKPRIPLCVLMRRPAWA